MTENEMKSKTFWITFDGNQTTSPNPDYKFALPSFLLEDQLKKNILVSKRVLTKVHRCTQGVFNEYKDIPGENVVELGNQVLGEKAIAIKGKLQFNATGL
jgi:hypothetical protein